MLTELIISAITPEVKAKRRILEIVDMVQSGNPHIFGAKPVFDGKKNIFSFNSLLPSVNEAVFSCKPEGAINEYIITIRFVAQVESRYLFLINRRCQLRRDVPVLRFVKDLINRNGSEEATHLLNILQVFISQHSNMCVLPFSTLSFYV